MFQLSARSTLTVLPPEVRVIIGWGRGLMRGAAEVDLVAVGAVPAAALVADAHVVDHAVGHEHRGHALVPAGPELAAHGGAADGLGHHPAVVGVAEVDVGPQLAPVGRLDEQLVGRLAGGDGRADEVGVPGVGVAGPGRQHLQPATPIGQDAVADDAVVRPGGQPDVEAAAAAGHGDRRRRLVGALEVVDEVLQPDVRGRRRRRDSPARTTTSSLDRISGWPLTGAAGQRLDDGGGRAGDGVGPARRGAVQRRRHPVGHLVGGEVVADPLQRDAPVLVGGQRQQGRGQPVVAGAQGVGGDGPGEAVVVADRVDHAAGGVQQHQQAAGVVQLAGVVAQRGARIQRVAGHRQQGGAVLGDDQEAAGGDAGAGGDGEGHLAAQLPAADVEGEVGPVVQLDELVLVLVVVLQHRVVHDLREHHRRRRRRGVGHLVGGQIRRGRRQIRGWRRQVGDDRAAGAAGRWARRAAAAGPRARRAGAGAGRPRRRAAACSCRAEARRSPGRRCRCRRCRRSSYRRSRRCPATRPPVPARRPSPAPALPPEPDASPLPPAPPLPVSRRSPARSDEPRGRRWPSPTANRRCRTRQPEQAPAGRQARRTAIMDSDRHRQNIIAGEPELLRRSPLVLPLGPCR